MGANPMQKMKRNSTLTGLVIGLVIGLILCAIVFMFLTAKGIGTKKGELTTVYVLTTTVKSGQTISLANVMPKNMSIEDVPADAVSISSDVIAKIDLSAGTILTSGMLNSIDAATTTNDLREQEYNMLALPSNLQTGDYIDIRIQLPNGGDYIVISKKEVINCNATTVWLNMYEEEIELMSNAIIEYYVMAGSKLYAAIYTDPGLQTAAVGTYVPNQVVASLIEANPNITSYINSDRYSDSLRNLRNKHINAALAPYYLDEDGDGRSEALDNVEANLQEEIESLQEAREAYFGALNATTY